MSRFEKLLKCFTENGGDFGDGTKLINFKWWMEGAILHYLEEYDGYTGGTHWKVNTANGMSCRKRYDGSRTAWCWTEWQAA